MAINPYTFCSFGGELHFELSFVFPVLNTRYYVGPFILAFLSVVIEVCNAQQLATAVAVAGTAIVTVTVRCGAPPPLKSTIANSKLKKIVVL